MPRTEVKEREEGIGPRKNLFEKLAIKHLQQQQRQETTTTRTNNNKKPTTNSTTKPSTSQSNSRSKAGKTSKLKGRSSDSSLMQPGQKSILNYLELKSMDPVTPKLKPIHSKVLCKPESDFYNVDRGMTTEDKKFTQVTCKTAEGREKL